MVQQIWKRKLFFLVTLLLVSTLVLAACGDNDPGVDADPEIGVETDTEDMTDEEMTDEDMTDEDMSETETMTDTMEMDDTEAMTDTMEMDDSETMTDTMEMDDSETMTDTMEMDDTEAMTGTMEMDDSETMTDTMEMDDSETMTDTTSMDDSEMTEPTSRMGFVGAEGQSVPASTVIGYSIENSADENLGSVEDLIVEIETGHINYVIVSFGGFLGIGDNYYAVPPQDFNWSPETADRSARLMIDITEEELVDAPQFSYDNDLTIDGWDGELRNYWDTRRGVDTAEAMEEEMVTTGFAGAEGQSVPATTLIGHSIENSADENLGSIEDLIVSLESSTIHYTVVSFGGFLGIGDNYYLVPPQDFNWIPATSDRNDGLTIDITEEELVDAPQFSYDDDLTIDGWDTDIRSYWDTRRGS